MDKSLLMIYIDSVRDPSKAENYCLSLILRNCKCLM
ncbi:hypothetical protein T12_10226, partial [Trichinella patagoniensis]